MKPGTPVTWQTGPSKNAIKLTGHIVSNGGAMAQVRANGEVYEVAVAKLRRAPNVKKPRKLCRVCGKPCNRPGNQYCSTAHFDTDRMRETDATVFAAIVAYKTENDGLSPTLERLSAMAYVSQSAVVRSLKRLEMTGKIWTRIQRTHKHIGITGGKWSYEGDL